MSKWAFGLLVAALSVATGVEAQTSLLRWARVTDSHGSSFEAPVSILTAKRDPSGLLTFTAEGGVVQVQLETITESRLGFPGNDPEGDMDLKRSDCTSWPPAYHVVKDRLGAYSCVKGGKVTYHLARYSPWGSVTLMVEYPQAEAAMWDPVVKRMAGSMRQVERREIH
jgi:hypothetical protein